jgi:hypothetical protein
VNEDGWVDLIARLESLAEEIPSSDFVGFSDFDQGAQENSRVPMVFPRVRRVSPALEARV